MKKTIGLLLLLTILTLTSCTTAADARIAEAQIAGQVQMERERQETQRQTAWLTVLPVLALIVILCGGVVGSAWLVLWYRGRIAVVQAQAAMMLPPPPQWPALPGPVQRAAIERNATAMPDPAMPGAWLLLLTDGRRVRMLPPPQHRQEY